VGKYLGGLVGSPTRGMTRAGMAIVERACMTSNWAGPTKRLAVPAGLHLSAASPRFAKLRLTV
jgi:hypothetical protein